MSRQTHGIEIHDGQVRKPKPHRVGVQIPHRVDTEMPGTTLYEELRKYLGEVFRKLAEQKESRIEEGPLMLDYVHMMISIPPKYAVSQVGYIKGHSPIH